MKQGLPQATHSRALLRFTKQDSYQASGNTNSRKCRCRGEIHALGKPVRRMNRPQRVAKTTSARSPILPYLPARSLHEAHRVHCGAFGQNPTAVVNPGTLVSLSPEYYFFPKKLRISEPITLSTMQVTIGK